jgi:hypothetical protein
MKTNRSFFGVACRTAAFSFLVAGSALLLQGQQTTAIAPTSNAPLLVASESAPLDLTSTGSSSSSSSSSSDSTASSDGRFVFGANALDSSQPPPRRRYGRPTYGGTNTNPDGSNKYFGLGGIGLELPVGDTHYYETPSYGFQIGAGRNFNKSVGVGLQFDYDHFGLQGATIANESFLFTGATSGQGFDGNNHVWSFTVNPTYTLATEGSAGLYLVVGGGFYHKVTNFTLPQQECADYYCEFVITVNQTCGAICHYTSNAGGVNGGFGLTWKFSKFSNERFYMEARYVLMLNSQRTGLTVADSTSPPYGTTSSPGSTYTGYDVYPANSNRTTYIPIKFGIRF